jgi:hypothetical protein
MKKDSPDPSFGPDATDERRGSTPPPPASDAPKCEAIPIPEWMDREASRRMDEMLADPSIALDHDTVWARIRRRTS